MSATLTYTLVVMGPAYGTQCAYQAYQFATALISTKHQLKQIFFYADGVLNANRFIQPANDEFNLLAAWQTLSTQHGISLVACVSAGLRRGIDDDPKVGNIATPFIAGGLTELSEAMAVSDRVIQF